ncbi:hypothetical protein VT03_11140 [Planctomyces sp. SH-PL14]|nr:hypothetical protein VT03_11140 [Planctomyces sp. SH-PL14]
MVRARFLIVVCSRRTRESQWVNREIVRFRELGRHDRILALLIDGEPHEAFPIALGEIRRAATARGEGSLAALELIEPLASDVRPRKDLTAKVVRTRARLRILASLLEVDFDDLRQREAERRRSQVMQFTIALGILLVGMVAGSCEYLRQRRATHAAEIQADKDRRLALAESAAADAARRNEAEAKKNAELAKQNAATAETLKKAQEELTEQQRLARVKAESERAW